MVEASAAARPWAVPLGGEWRRVLPGLRPAASGPVHGHRMGQRKKPRPGGRGLSMVQTAADQSSSGKSSRSTSRRERLTLKSSTRTGCPR